MDQQPSRRRHVARSRGRHGVRRPWPAPDRGALNEKKPDSRRAGVWLAGLTAVVVVMVVMIVVAAVVMRVAVAVAVVTAAWLDVDHRRAVVARCWRIVDRCRGIIGRTRHVDPFAAAV